MTILLYKNGQWLIDGEQPLEGVSLDNLAAILTNPADGDVIKYDEASGMWIAGKAIPAVSAVDNGKVLTVSDGAWTPASPANPLPSVSSSDNGKVLAVVDGAWAAENKRKNTTSVIDGPKYYIYVNDLQSDPAFYGPLQAVIHGKDLLADIMNDCLLTARVMFNSGNGNYEPMTDIVFQPTELRWDNAMKNIAIQTSIIDFSSLGVDKRGLVSCRCLSMEGAPDFDDPTFGAAYFMLM